ncbi:MAG TPA: disulfide bond formation protein B [Dokdonella sp.]|uniref:disulfide bond formation protein B n=1 Tax=Dokdonella sp. TaxID=2291710 RepID=UPI002D8068C0|nr:disulfide bond formation protein B [Dokdonella sp.]HET9034171.1 disulfide bond formation protein B [Dokdonella sp.]
MIRVSSRKIFLMIACASALLMGYALFAQYVQHYEPCMLCMVQRVFVCAVGLVALIAALHGPGRFGARVYGLLTALFAVGGGYIAARHVYLQNLPPEQLDGCAPSFEYALGNFDSLKFLKTIFIRDQDCGVIDWTFLGLAMPAWVFLCFVVLFFAALWAGFRRG